MPSEPTFENIRDRTLSAFNAALTIGGAAGNPLLIANFIGQSIFSTIRLIQLIRNKQRELELELDQEIKSRDILRQPIYGNLDDALFISFFHPGGMGMNFPDLLLQLQPEVDEFNPSPALASPLTKRTLRFAHLYLFPIFRDARTNFEDREYQTLFGDRLLLNDPPQWGRIAREAALLFPAERLRPKIIEDQAGAFFQNKLEQEILTLHDIEASKQKEMKDAFIDFIKGAVFDRDGFLNKSVAFVKQKKLNDLDDLITDVDRQIAKTPITDRVILAELNKRKAELTAFKASVNMLTTGN